MERRISPIFVFCMLNNTKRLNSTILYAAYSPGAILQTPSGYCISSGRAKGVSFANVVFLHHLMVEKDPKVAKFSPTVWVCTLCLKKMSPNLTGYRLNKYPPIIGICHQQIFKNRMQV